jgi:hypothetical protein
MNHEQDVEQEQAHKPLDQEIVLEVAKDLQVRKVVLGVEIILKRDLKYLQSIRYLLYYSWVFLKWIGRSTGCV